MVPSLVLEDSLKRRIPISRFVFVFVLKIEIYKEKEITIRGGTESFELINEINKL